MKSSSCMISSRKFLKNFKKPIRLNDPISLKEPIRLNDPISLKEPFRLNDPISQRSLLG